MSAPQRFTTADGSTVEARCVGDDWYDVHLRNAAGRSVATVSMRGAELRSLAASTVTEAA